MFNTILVALDPEEDCTYILEQAVDMAKRTDAELELMGVLTPTSDNTLAWATYYPEISIYSTDATEEIWLDYQRRYEDHKNRVKVALGRWVNRALSAGVSAGFFQAEGPAGREICDRAKAIHADLIVVGSHGRTGLSEIFMGSVSNYVMHHAPCSVLVIHTPKAQSRQEIRLKTKDHRTKVSGRLDR